MDTNTGHRPQPVASLVDFVAAHARSAPDAGAVEYGDRTWTWAQWHQRIRQLAGALRAVGLRPGDRIAFLDKVNPACVEVLFAAASIGAVTASVNWRLSGDELAYILDDSAPKMLVVGGELAPATRAILPRYPALRTLVVGGEHDTYEQFIAAGPATAADPAVDRADDTLLIYSSGTTGRPKGVLISQAALIKHGVDLAGHWPFAEGDINFLIAPLFHVAGLSDAIWGIRAGVLSIFSRETTAQTLLAAIAAGATHAFVAVPVVGALVAADDATRDAVGRLKYLGYGASPMPVPLLERAIQAWPQVNLVQAYGQTELSGAAATLGPDDHRDRAHPERLGSVGKVVTGVEVQVTDLGHGTPLGPGEQGELWFRSVYQMSGYLNLQEATAATITPEGWLRTGDIGHLDHDGYVYIDDRIRDMIITGGENVYSPEVERVLYQHPAIVEAAVIGVPDELWGESVRAVAVVSGPVDPEDIIAFCRTHLAAYKCPKGVDFTTALPRNHTGKVLKRELRELFSAHQDKAI